MTLFFNLPGTFEVVSSKTFYALGIADPETGDNLHALGETYYSYPVFGVSIVLEMNSYDYEADYQYMIYLKPDFSSDLKEDEKVEALVLEVIARLLVVNPGIEIAIEGSGGLSIFQL